MNLPDKKYNQLPTLLRKYLYIIYSETYENGITIFKTKHELWGALKLTHGLKSIIFSHKILVEPIYKSVSFYPKLNIFLACSLTNDTSDKSIKYWVIYDRKGKIIKEIRNITSIHINQFQDIIITKDKLDGVTNENFEYIIEPQYRYLHSIQKGIFVAELNNLWGIINSKNEILLPFENCTVFNNALNNKTIIEKGKGEYFVFDYTNLQREKLSYSKILSARSNTYDAPANEDWTKYKVLINCKEEYSSSDEMEEYIGKWGIIDANGVNIIPCMYDYIDFCRNPFYYKVAVGKMEFDNDEKNDLVISSKNVKWGIINKLNQIVVPIEYEWLDEIEDGLWIANKAGTVFFEEDGHNSYWSVKDGKIGVVNAAAKIIVPIEYDVIKTNYYRVKDYLFVQKGTTYFDSKLHYDVYTFDGIKIEKNKPDAQNHTYYKR